MEEEQCLIDLEIWREFQHKLFENNLSDIALYLSNKLDMSNSIHLIILLQDFYATNIIIPEAFPNIQIIDCQFIRNEAFESINVWLQSIQKSISNDIFNSLIYIIDENKNKNENKNENKNINYISYYLQSEKHKIYCKLAQNNKRIVTSIKPCVCLFENMTKLRRTKIDITRTRMWDTYPKPLLKLISCKICKQNFDNKMFVCQTCQGLAVCTKTQCIRHILRIYPIDLVISEWKNLKISNDGKGCQCTAPISIRKIANINTPYKMPCPKCFILLRCTSIIWICQNCKLIHHCDQSGHCVR